MSIENAVNKGARDRRLSGAIITVALVVAEM
jgi:hypothetical protein